MKAECQIIILPLFPVLFVVGTFALSFCAELLKNSTKLLQCVLGPHLVLVLCLPIWLACKSSRQLSDENMAVSNRLTRQFWVVVLWLVSCIRMGRQNPKEEAK